MNVWRCAIVPDASGATAAAIAAYHPTAYDANNANPAVRMLRYYNASYSSQWEGLSSTVGVPLAEARAGGWVLRNSSGKEITHPSWPYNYLCNIGSAGYQDAWVRNVNGWLLATDADGVYMDDVNPRVGVALAPADSVWQQWTDSFLAYVIPRLNAPVYANIGWEWDTDAVCRRWVTLVDGVVKEHWMKWGGRDEGYSPEGTATSPGMFDLQFAYANFVVAQKRSFLALTTSDGQDSRAARYGIGALLLSNAWDGYFALSGDFKTDTFRGEHAKAVSLGAPKGPRFRTTYNNWRRTFLHGRVTVNPSATSRGGLPAFSAVIE